MPKLTHRTAALRAIARNIRLLSDYENYDEDMLVQCELCFATYRTSLKEIIKENKCTKCGPYPDYPEELEKTLEKTKEEILREAGIFFALNDGPEGKYHCEHCRGVITKTLSEIKISVGCDNCALNFGWYKKKCELYASLNGLVLLEGSLVEDYLSIHPTFMCEKKHMITASLPFLKNN